LLFFLVISFILELPVPVDEINALALVSSATQDNHTAFIVVSGGTVKDLYVLDHDSREIRLLDDGRVRLTTTSRVYPTDKGFTVVDGTEKMLYKISRGCAFVDSYRLEQLAELGTSIKLTASAVIDKEHLAFTYRNLEDRGTLFLARFNLLNKTLETLHAVEADGGFWAFHDTHWFFLEDETGRIKLLDKDFKKVSELNRGREKFSYPLPPEVKAIFDEKGSSTYAKLIDGSFVDKHKIRFWSCAYAEDWPKTQVKYSQIVLADGKVACSESTQMVLAKTESFSLVYDQSTNEFTIK